MPINLNRFVQATEAIVPLIGNTGKYQGRKIEIEAEDGWYKVSLGNQATIVKKASPLDIRRALQDKSKLMVYALGGEGVPVNFDNFKQRGLGESVYVNFMVAQPFDVAEVVLWEDGRFYFYGINQRHQRETLRGVKKSFEDRENVPELRGISPEIRYAFLLGNLQRESYETVEALLRDGLGALGSDSRTSILHKLKQSFGSILKRSIAAAGGTYHGHRQLAKGRYLVEWEVGGQRVKSEIQNDLRILSAGFCLSGDDRRHSMNSIIGLAKMFQENRPLYIERE